MDLRSDWRDVIQHGEPWALVHGDCLEVMREMPDGCVTHVITDPPYCEHVHGNARTNAKASTANKLDIAFASITPKDMACAAQHFARLALRWSLVFHGDGNDWRGPLERAGPEYIRQGIWVRLGSMPQQSGDRPAQGHECIAIAHAPGRKRWNGGGRPAVWSHPLGGRAEDCGRVHETQKPLSLMLALVRDFTEPGDIVFDPYAGSGTTGVACRQLGRRFIGIELDAKHAATARRRIGETLEQADLITDEAFRREAKRKREQLGLGLGESEEP